MATKILAGYSYDKDSQRYRNGSTGRFVGRKAVVGLLDEQIKSTESRMDALADAFTDGKIAPAVYAERMRTEVRRVHLQQAALAKGGWDKLNQSDYGKVGAATRDVYARVTGTTEDIVNGDASVAQVKNRNSAYAGSARRLFHNVERGETTPTEGKVTVEQRILDPNAQHCEDCLNYSAMGVQSFGTLPVPGEDCQCRDNCRCQLRKWEVDEKDAERILSQRESGMAKDKVFESDDCLPEVIELQEAAIRADGTAPIKLIAPGWGTKGYYPKEMLKEHGPKAFPDGTLMRWNHPTAMEESERPEGDMDNLAAVTLGDARWDDNGPDGPALYAESYVFDEYKDKVKEKAKFTGLSIAARGEYKIGEAEGKKGKIVQSIFPQDIAGGNMNNVDFVTVAGAGGKVLELFESARSRNIQPVVKEDNTVSEKLEVKLTEALDVISQLKEANDKLLAHNARTSEALLLREAKDFVVAQLATSDLPKVTQTRLAESLSGFAPIVDGNLDGESFKTAIDEAIKSETEYLAEAIGASTGRITGMGSNGGGFKSDVDDHDIEETQKRLSSAFERLGLSESNAEFATNGRVF